MCNDIWYTVMNGTFFLLPLLLLFSVTKHLQIHAATTSSRFSFLCWPQPCPALGYLASASCTETRGSPQSRNEELTTTNCPCLGRRSRRSNGIFRTIRTFPLARQAHTRSNPLSCFQLASGSCECSELGIKPSQHKRGCSPVGLYLVSAQVVHLSLSSSRGSAPFG